MDAHGAPLVLQSDNGSALQSDDFGRLLAERKITWLPSPPRTPRYNGGCLESAKQESETSSTTSGRPSSVARPLNHHPEVHFSITKIQKTGQDFARGTGTVRIHIVCSSPETAVWFQKSTNCKDLSGKVITV
jgi:transposase InsO family protein